MTTTAVKERPILFSAEMVRAILDGRKTQTRRVVKPQPPMVKAVNYVEHSLDKSREGRWSTQDHPEWVVDCPYGRPGDRLWVRETWLPFRTDHVIDGKRYAYAADSTGDADAERCRIELGYKWRPSIHMPRAASRLTLEIESVRVERVQDITADDVDAEGLPASQWSHVDGWRRNEFAALWDQINGKGAWDRNDWCWVIQFRRLP